MKLLLIQAVCAVGVLVLIAIVLSCIDRKQQVKRMHKMRRT